MLRSANREKRLSTPLIASNHDPINFAMKEDGTIREMNSIFVCIGNDLATLGEPISKKN